MDNQDPTPEEFESYELNREKVIMGSSKVTLFGVLMHQGLMRIPVRHLFAATSGLVLVLAAAWLRRLRDTWCRRVNFPLVQMEFGRQLWTSNFILEKEISSIRYTSALGKD